MEDGSVQQNRLAPGSVDQPKIAPGAVKIEVGQIEVGQITDESIRAAFTSDANSKPTTETEPT